MRSEFEKLPKTNELLEDGIYFDEKSNRYKVSDGGCLISTVFLNGRWEAYQNRQTEVDELQKRVDLLEGKIKEALNTVYAMKGKADCDHLTDKEQSFVYGFGYELHEILKEEQALKGESNE